MDREYMREELRKGVCNVTFTKVDGTERVMNCTLDMGFVPEEKLPKGTGRAESEEVLRVFDTDKTEWRSFRVESVTKFLSEEVEVVE